MRKEVVDGDLSRAIICRDVDEDVLSTRYLSLGEFGLSISAGMLEQQKPQSTKSRIV